MKSIKFPYLYAIVVNNNDDRNLARETTTINNDFKNTKFALIEKQVNKDGTENINRIIYDDDINKLSEDAKKYVSYYNYVAGFKKNIQQYVSEIS